MSTKLRIKYAYPRGEDKLTQGETDKVVIDMQSMTLTCTLVQYREPWTPGNQPELTGADRKVVIPLTATVIRDLLTALVGTVAASPEFGEGSKMEVVEE